MAKREPSRRPSRPREPTRQQLIKRLQRHGLTHLGNLRGEVGLERIADHTRRLKQQSRPGRELSELARQRRRDRRRHGSLTGHATINAPDMRARELLKVERVAPAQREDRPRVCSEQLAGLGTAERPQLDPRRTILGHRSGQRPAERHRKLTLACRQHEEHAGGRWPTHERGQRIGRRRVGPMHVIETKHQCAGGGLRGPRAGNSRADASFSQARCARFTSGSGRTVCDR